MLEVLEEIIDIVDQNDIVVGQVVRSEINRNLANSNFRGINVFIENDKGELWIPRRTATKRLFPLCLDVSIGGCVSAGETYEQALLREAQEEVNLDLNKVPYEFLAYFTPHKDKVGCFMKVYKIFMNQAPDYNPDDFCEYFWLSPQELLNKINAGEPAKSDLLKLLNLLYTKSNY